MNHTPEPSTRTPDKFHVVEIDGPVEPQQKWNVATVDHTPVTKAECVRMLACYTACAGIDDPVKDMPGIINDAVLTRIRAGSP